MTKQSVNALTLSLSAPDSTKPVIRVNDTKAIELNAWGEYLSPGDFSRYVDYLTARAGGFRPLAYALDVNAGILVNVIRGGDSPTLRRILNNPKHPRRSRLTVNATPETIARFDAARGSMTRAEYLVYLLEVGNG